MILFGIFVLTKIFVLLRFLKTVEEHFVKFHQHTAADFSVLDDELEQLQLKMTKCLKDDKIEPIALEVENLLKKLAPSIIRALR
jgi:CHAD domain-containing protein